MKGLLLKDFYITKSTMIYMLLFSVVYSILAVLFSGNIIFSFLMVIMLGTIGATSFEYESKTNWDKYEGALPLTIKKRVAIKFFLPLAYIITTSIIIFIAVCVTEKLFNRLNIVANISLLIISVSMALIIASLYITFTYKFGIAKSKIFLIIICAIFGGIVGLLASSYSHSRLVQNIININLEIKSIIFIIFGLIFAFIMYNISVHIVNKNKSR